MFLYFLGFGTVFVIYKYLNAAQKKKDPFPLLKQNWKKDVVYLVQFPISPKVRSISPFSIKLETWLRMTEIPYETIYNPKMSKKGQIPYIELNGEQIPDSNLAMDYLKNYFKEAHPKVLEEESLLTPEQAGISHMTKQMIENHTCLAGFYYRYVLHMAEFYEKMIVPSEDAYPSAIGLKFFRYVTPKIVQLRLYLHGMGRHSPEEIATFSCQDLAAVSTTLGNKKYYLGDKPTSIDCTLFGHLVQFLYIPLDFPQKMYMKENCQNVVEYVERMKQEFWPDWNEQCLKSCMDGNKGGM